MEWAHSLYINLLNQTRFTKNLTPDPNVVRSLHPKTPTKWAILCVLTTKYYLTVSDIQDLLNGLSYRRSKSHIRKGLSRCLRFGLVANTTYTKKDVRWQMTQRGLQALNMPKTMKTKATQKVREVMDKATAWLSVSDVEAQLNNTVSRSTIRKVFRREGTHANSTNLIAQNGHIAIYKGMKIPGDHYGRMQWALATVDTSHWSNAAFTPWQANKKPKQKKAAKPTRAGGAVISISPKYQGIPMCLPDSTAKKLTLISAVGDLVTKVFVPEQKKFSAHDVTARLRKDLANYPIDTTETGTVWVQNKQVAKIEHEDVKAIVHELFNQQQMAGYDRVHVGSHFEYDLAANIAANTTPVAPVVTAPDPTSPDPTIVGQDGTAYDGSSTL